MNYSSGIYGRILLARDENSLLKDNSGGSGCFIPYFSNEIACTLAKHNLFYNEALFCNRDISDSIAHVVLNILLQ